MATSEHQHPPAGVGTQTDVTSSTSSVVILAANVNRLGATIHNESNSRLYLRLATGSATVINFTKRLESQQSYEVPSGYTGIINGIWAPIVSGAARVTEFTP